MGVLGMPRTDSKAILSFETDPIQFQACSQSSLRVLMRAAVTVSQADTETLRDLASDTETEVNTILTP